MDHLSTLGGPNRATTAVKIKSRIDSCFVPMCPSTSRKFPNKLFLTGPTDPKLREKWFQAAKRDEHYSSKTIIRCCEDHFDLENDVENWMKFKFFGGKLFLKKDVIPHFFECQNRMMPVKPRRAVLKRKRREILESLANTLAPSMRSTLVTETYDSQNIKISNHNSVQLNEQEIQPGPSGGRLCEKTSGDPDSLDFNVSGTGPEDPLALGPHTLDQCRFCGEFNKDCVNVIDTDKPYVTSNQTTLTLNDLSVELDFNYPLPKTVCRICDRKLQAMFEFVKQVKEAQDSLINLGSDGIEEVEVLVVKTECESPTPDDNEDGDIKDEIVESITVTETEFVKQAPFTSKQKRKSDNDTPKTKKPKVIKDAQNELIIDIKEETAEIDETCEAEYLEFSDTETNVELSELELTTKALLSEITDKETLS